MSEFCPGTTWLNVYFLGSPLNLPWEVQKSEQGYHSLPPYGSYLRARCIFGGVEISNNCRLWERADAISGRWDTLGKKCKRTRINVNDRVSRQRCVCANQGPKLTPHGPWPQRCYGDRTPCCKVRMETSKQLCHHQRQMFRSKGASKKMPLQGHLGRK